MPHLDMEQLEKDSRVSRYTWRGWIHQGRIPVVRLGRRVLVDEVDYRKFLAHSRVEARPLDRAEQADLNTEDRRLGRSS